MYQLSIDIADRNLVPFVRRLESAARRSPSAILCGDPTKVPAGMSIAFEVVWTRRTHLFEARLLRFGGMGDSSNRVAGGPTSEPGIRPGVIRASVRGSRPLHLGLIDGVIPGAFDRPLPDL